MVSKDKAESVQMWQFCPAGVL
ncbi:hypothetical protein AZE42_08816 [Rhizopogon vesiculosus]|uniref:Uncharacterized protein n=1 Tax=Rhizopogon vesiculosus TaxID=180088 RepID=A0A1J8R1R1_9AGAM|nr:hypothetical protein AZE42_08816 [Rhizopogon vesiculosus]